MSTGERAKGREGKEGGRFFYIYIYGSLNFRRGEKRLVGMESVVFVIIHTTSVEYNNKVTVLCTGEKCARKIKNSWDFIMWLVWRVWFCLLLVFFFFLSLSPATTRSAMQTNPQVLGARKYLARVWNTHLGSRPAPGLRARWGSWWPPRRCPGAGWRARRHRR